MFVADFRSFDAEFFGLTIDAFTTRSLGVDGMIEWAVAIKQDALQSARFPVGIFVTALPVIVAELLTRLIAWSGQDEGAAEALSTIAIGMPEEKARNHAQAFGAARNAIGITGAIRLGGVGIEGNSSNATVMGGFLIDVPGIIGSIGGQMGGEVGKGKSSLIIEGAEVGNITFIKGQGIFSQHDIAIVGSSGSSHTGTIAPDELFLFFRGAVSLLLIGGAFDTELAVGVASTGVRFVKAFREVDTRVVFTDPGVDMLDVEGDDLAESGNLFFEVADGGVEQGLQQGGIKVAELFAQPGFTRKGLLKKEAIGLRGIKLKMEIQVDDQQGMGEQEVAQLAGVEEALTNTNEEGFEIGSLRMTRSTASRALLLPVCNDTPIEKRKKGAMFKDNGIMIKQSGHGGLVKKMGRGYHNRKLLCMDGQ